MRCDVMFSTAYTRLGPKSDSLTREGSSVAILMNVIGAELVRATMEVSCKILHRNYIGAHCFPRVVSTFQFFDHQLAEIGNNNLLDGGYFRSATTADKLAREASAASASFKSASTSPLPFMRVIRLFSRYAWLQDGNRVAPRGATKGRIPQG
jgi:hypothetical protein